MDVTGGKALLSSHKCATQYIGIYIYIYIYLHTHITIHCVYGRRVKMSLMQLRPSYIDAIFHDVVPILESLWTHVEGHKVF